MLFTCRACEARQINLAEAATNFYYCTYSLSTYVFVVASKIFAGRLSFNLEDRRAFPKNKELLPLSHKESRYEMHAVKLSQL
jgi:hypothetical protein